MKKVTFLPYASASALPSETPMIAIGSPHQHYVYKEVHENRLELKFNDKRWEGPEMFTMEQANMVLRFVDRMPEDKTLVVHCGMGMSRSAAVAKFLTDFMGYELDARYPGCLGSTDDKNYHVYETLAEAYFLREEQVLQQQEALA